MSDEYVDGVVQFYLELDAESHTMGLPPGTEEGIRDWFEQLALEGWNLLAAHDETVVGHVGVAPVAADEPKFVIFVQDDYQGRGIGTELLKHLIAYANAKGHDGLKLDVATTNDHAIRIYREVGFELNEADAPQPADLLKLELGLSLSEATARDVQLPPAAR